MLSMSVPSLQIAAAGSLALPLNSRPCKKKRKRESHTLLIYFEMVGRVCDRKPSAWPVCMINRVSTFTSY